MKISLKVKTAIGIVCMSIIISAVAVVLSYNTYANTMDDHYEKMTLDLAETAIAMLDADKIQQYAETLEMDEDYETQRDILCRLVEANDEAEYIDLQQDLLKIQTRKTYAVAKKERVFSMPLYGYVYYNEARLVLCLRKLYTDRIRPEGFADPALLSHYAAADFHTVYVYEIEQILRAEDEA